MMSATGSTSRMPATAKSSGLSCPSRRWNHQASISGMAIFMSSLGWMTVMPTSSQRCEPLRMMPKNSTPSSSITPVAYRGSASDINRCGGTCDTRNIRPHGQQHVAAVGGEPRAVIETHRIHGDQARAGHQQDREQQPAVETLEDRGDALQQGGFVEDGGHGPPIILRP